MHSESIRYIGVNDHEIDLFEGQYPVPLGMSYNAWVILDEKVCVLDTVDRSAPGTIWRTWRLPWRAATRTTWWSPTWSPTTPPPCRPSWTAGPG